MTATAVVRGHAAVDDDDATLLERLRRGEVEAYAGLWRRHLASAYRMAHRYRGRASAEDIVGEASLRVFERIQAGQGPTSNFRAYFLNVVKNVALDLHKADLRLVPTDTTGLEACATAVAPYDAAVRVDQDLVRVAFGRLSARDQQVLWQTAVLGAPPAVIGVAIGLSPNGVSAAAMRARDALRAAYLDAHADRAVERTRSAECRWVLTQLGRYVRGKLRGNRRARVERHLQDCRHAQVLASELTEINLNLPALIVPLVFVAGAGSTAAWCSAAITAGQHGSAPQSVPVDQGSSALVGVAASATGVITKVAVAVTAAALGAGLTNTAGIGSLSMPSAQAHRASDMLRFFAPDSVGDGMPEISLRGEGQTTDGTAAGTVQPKAPEVVDPAAAGAGVPDDAGAVSGPVVQAATTTVSTDASTSAPSVQAAPSATGSTGTASTTTAGKSSGTTTVKAKKGSQTPEPVAPESPITPSTPTAPEPASTTSLPPGQAKKLDKSAPPNPNSCNNPQSQARACRGGTAP